MIRWSQTHLRGPLSTEVRRGARPARVARGGGGVTYLDGVEGGGLLGLKVEGTNGAIVQYDGDLK